MPKLKAHFDEFANEFNGFDKDFDEGGKIALEGKINQNLANNFLDKLKKSQ